MSEWWTYRLGDFLLFAPDTWLRLVMRHNEGLWPLPLAMLALGAGLAVLAARGGRRLPAAVQAPLWAFVGWGYLLGAYAPINWAATQAAWMFGVQACLLLLLAWAGPRPAAAGTARHGAGLALMAYGVAVHPLVGPLLGRPWPAAEVVGIMPTPTALLTLGMLVLATGRLRWLLLPVPVAWLAFDGLTLLAMGMADAWPVLALAALCPALMLLPGRAKAA